MAKRKYFGTDGVRGKANKFPMDNTTAMKIGMAAGIILRNGGHKHRVVIGKDTRLSGYMIESALTAGFNSVGIDVFLIGPIPTPGIAMLTRSMRCDLGVMISASHNPYYDNGIKLFDSKGRKFPDEIEEKIEQVMEKQDLSKYLVEGDKIGKAWRSDNYIFQQRYIEFVKNTFPRNLTLKDVKIVLDCANGAAYKVAPTILWELGANVITIGDKPNGLNINKECGSTHIDLLQKTVVEEKADLGIALDGDADRVIMVDENGKKIDGDKIIALIAKKMVKQNELKGEAVVVTKMSNLGLEKYLNSLGLDVLRTKVGDRYVTEKMRKYNYNFGGEQSGHIILGDFSTTGDGLCVALQVLSMLCRKRLKNGKKQISELVDLYDTIPQVLENVEYDKKNNPLTKPSVKKIIQKYEEKLKDNGRILIRKSGTQPLIRVMVECTDKKKMNTAVKDIVKAIKREIK